MSEKFASFVVRWRIPIIVLSVAISAFFASRIPQTRLEPEIKKMLPADFPARLAIEKIDQLFGGTDMIMLVVEADDVLAEPVLRRLRELGRRLERIPGVARVLSPFTLKDIRADGDQLVVDPVVKNIPRTQEDREKLRAAIRDNDMVFGNVISADFRAAALIGLLEVNVSDQQVMEAVTKLIDQVPGPEAVHIAGMPFIRTQIARDMQSDMRRFLPLGLLIMLVFLQLCFKQLRGVLLPSVVVVMAIAFSMGLIPLLGWSIHMITILLPVILIAVANDYGIHLVARYQEENRPGVEANSALLSRRAAAPLLVPVIVCGTTTIAGLLSLLSHVAVPARQLGLLAGAGVAFALLLSLTFVPAALAVLPRPRPLVGTLTRRGKRRPLEVLLEKLAGLVVRRKKVLLGSFFLAAAIIAGGIFRIKVDTNPINYYEEEAPVRKVSALVDKNFGGSGSLAIVAEGDMKDPQVLKQIDELEKSLSRLPEVGQTSSVARIVRRMNRVMNENRSEEDRIPDSAEAVAQYYLLYSMSGEPEDFEKVVDFDYRHALCSLRVNTLSVEAIGRVMEKVEQEITSRPKGMFPLAGGFVDLLYRLVDVVVRGQIYSLFLSLGLVCLLVMIGFRSLVAGLVAALPLSLAMVMLFGLMGYAGIELNIATAMLASIMIGVGVDYTVHILWRYRDERRAGLGSSEAMQRALTTTGRGIFFNALSVIVGFVVVMSSNFQPVRFFGFLVLVSVGTCLLGALVLVPALLLIWEPKFIAGTKGQKV